MCCGSTRTSSRISSQVQLPLEDATIRLHSDDYADSLPVLPFPNPYPNGVGAYYKHLARRMTFYPEPNDV
jgi:hypothetical protein